MRHLRHHKIAAHPSNGRHRHMQDIIAYVRTHITRKNILHTKVAILGLAGMKMFVAEAIVIKGLLGSALFLKAGALSAIAAVPIMAQAAWTIGIDMSDVEPLSLKPNVVISAEIGATPEERAEYRLQQEEQQRQEIIQQTLEQQRETAYQEYVDAINTFYASDRTIYPDWMKPHMPEYQHLLSEEEKETYQAQSPLNTINQDTAEKEESIWGINNDNLYREQHGTASLPQGTVSQKTHLQGRY